jgi:glycogen debranching enzyme
MTQQAPAHASGAQHLGATTAFDISAPSSFQEGQLRTLKHGDTFAVFDRNGNIGGDAAAGLYHRDTRYLSYLYLTLSGTRPILLSSTVRDDNATLTCDLTNPDLYDGDHLVLAHDRVHVQRSKFLWNATCFERIALRNFADGRQPLTLVLDFAADFADLFEVRGTVRAKHGVHHRPVLGSDAVRLAYTGLDEERRETRLWFNPAPTRLSTQRAVFDFDLAAGNRAALFVGIHCGSAAPVDDGRRMFFVSLRQSREALRRSSARAVAIGTSNQIFNEALGRSVADLYMLITDLPEGPYPYAGIPWFSTVFGRDALITALNVLWMDPSIARGVLRYLAANQATEHDEAADAEPGKILHEVRHGEMAVVGEVPFRRYYGSVDSTPLFVMVAGAYFERTHDLNEMRRLWPHIEAALAWIDDYGDRDGDGFIEYGRRTQAGLPNQGWKDSPDSVFHADGTLAEGPIALVEVQGYVYAAKRAAATIAAALGHHVRAAELERRAEVLADAFDAVFWDDALGTYVLALDGVKRPCRARASNAGHALFTGIARPARAESIVRTLMGRTSFSGWGIRTVPTLEPRYNPMSYHNGSVWPHDNALIAAGFGRYGFAREAAQLFQGLFEASIYIDLRRLPELFCGFARRRTQGPTIYPVACTPQAWAATAPLSLLQTCLGLGFEPANRRITFDRPVLPAFLDEVTLRGLTMGDVGIDVMLRRAGAEVAVNVLSRRGDIHVTITS